MNAADAGNPSNTGDSPGLIPFSLDLTLDEVRRRAEVVAALGADWDPVEVLRGEAEAYALLYSGLDAEQQRLHDELVAAGVLPGGGTRTDGGPGEGPGRAPAR
ncbi:DUF6400 family protein [Streptomyces sp. NRRL F-5123]|uniref:DUF6400 family protein n=1 Tax=Streptomyces sp. NRRL F-5123 TaxID=1463856 RepID=UPI000694DF88|nr:DUF6400 family protein [Streptomyces sp. NRRL F-5123]